MTGCGCLDCTDVLVPIGPQGPRGPAGNNGTDGNDGANGTTVLFNSISNVVTTGTALETLKSYTLPANTLATDDSYIKINARFSTSTSTGASSTKTVSVYFNGSELVSYNFTKSNIGLIEFELDIDRQSNTSIKYKFISEEFANGTAYSQARLTNNYNSIGGLNLTTNTYDIEAKGDSMSAGDITCRSLTITKYTK